ncbi:uncharacterized protein LOC143548065 [Bidens hawaiensis]|uniref:uncharacterized protein LOC143548065 n=1 Tax=Bidens hawaiensis TaxID=980011 RepID=UPI00404A593A
MELCGCPESVEALTLLNCTSVTAISFPTGGQKLKSLKIWGCKKLLERVWGGEKMNNTSNTPMLDYVIIDGWANMRSIIELNSFVHLTTLLIRDCESLESFPDNELPSLTSLKRLEITNCPRMDICFPRGVWPPNLSSLIIGKLKKSISAWGPQNFPASLVELYLDGDDCSSELFSPHLLPSSLTDLGIIGFEKLESFTMGLQHLTSLQHLSFSNCPKLKKVSHPQHLARLQHLTFFNCPEMTDLPVVLFPSLLSLRGYGSLNLKERYRKGGSFWSLISHIPCIDIC